MLGTLPLVVVAGLLGSAHCIGMCGPFALMIGGSAQGWRAGLRRQLIYTLGRIFTYATLGAVAGAAGLYLAQRVPAFVNVAALLAVAAGVFLVAQGLMATGWWRRRVSSKHQGAGGLAAGFIGRFLRSPTSTGVFLAGLLTGLLPCGLVYGFLALAASSGQVIHGAMLMACFGVGTAPVMIATGSGSMFLSVATRQRLLSAAAWCVVLTGLLSIGRGVGFIEAPGWFVGSGCPLCHPN